jgi:hypothetical protein
MIWLVMVRYMTAFVAGITWMRVPLVVRVLWLVVLVAMVVRDTFFDGLLSDLYRSRVCSGGERQSGASGPVEGARELGEDRQVGVELDATDASDSEGKE